MHRALASKILASYGRTPLARPICDQIFHWVKLCGPLLIEFHSGIGYPNTGGLTPSATGRTKDSNMAKLKKLVSMIYEESW